MEIRKAVFTITCFGAIPMKSTIDIGTILNPIPGENPAGADLRYTPIYDEIKEARRADDLLDRGDWAREIKTSDWDKVIDLAVDALTHKTKDLQIAAWLCEALTEKKQFDGLFRGSRGAQRSLERFLGASLSADRGGRPRLSDRAHRVFEQQPRLADQTNSAHRQRCHSRLLLVQMAGIAGGGQGRGHAQPVRGRGRKKKKRREELIAEGKLKAEDFELAVIQSPATYYVTLDEKIARCREAFQSFDEVGGETIRHKECAESPGVATDL